jgi:hypothetical protein
MYSNYITKNVNLFVPTKIFSLELNFEILFIIHLIYKKLIYLKNSSKFLFKFLHHQENFYLLIRIKLIYFPLFS